MHIRTYTIKLTISFGDWYYFRCKFTLFLLQEGNFNPISPRLGDRLFSTKVLIVI